MRLYNASLEMNGVVNLSLRLREHSLVSLMLMEKLEVNDGSVNKNENVDELNMMTMISRRMLLCAS